MSEHCGFTDCPREVVTGMSILGEDVAERDNFDFVIRLPETQRLMSMPLCRVHDNLWHEIETRGKKTP